MRVHLDLGVHLCHGSAHSCGDECELLWMVSLASFTIETGGQKDHVMQASSMVMYCPPVAMESIYSSSRPYSHSCDCRSNFMTSFFQRFEIDHALPDLRGFVSTFTGIAATALPDCSASRRQIGAMCLYAMPLAVAMPLQSCFLQAYVHPPSTFLDPPEECFHLSVLSVHKMNGNKATGSNLYF